MTIKSFDELIALATEKNISFKVKVEDSKAQSPYETDILFHIPLIAMSILLAVRRTRKGLPIGELSSWVAGMLKTRYPRLDESAVRLTFSIALRRRIADAVFFLETVGLVKVSETSPRMVQISDKGREFINREIAREDTQGALIRSLRDSAEVVHQRGLEFL